MRNQLKKGSETIVLRSVHPGWSRMKHGNDPEIMPGDETTFQSYGVAWANLSNAPFREYKHFVHEGGIATPLIAHWPKGIESKGGLRKETGQLTDIMATIVDVCEAEWPDEGKEVYPPMRGKQFAA